MRFPLLALLALLALPTAARAEWLEASSAHFVVYADDSERDARRFSEQLERYHQAMSVMTSLRTEAPSPSNRVTVYVVKNQAEIARLAGVDSRYLGGFYIPRPGGSVAFVPRVNARTGQADLSMITLLHEYAHHFLISNSPFPEPRWVAEGAAEFFASAEFLGDGGVKIGLPSANRYMDLTYAENVKVEELMDPDLYEQRRGKRYDTFYAKSWALYHYLSMGEDRKGQLTAYLRALRVGKTSRQAAEEAFGDFDKLERDLYRYLRRSTMLTAVFRPDQLEAPTVSVRRLTAGEVAMMSVRIRSKRGVNEEQAAALVTEARAVAARYPDDAAVLAALAEAEHDSGHEAEAVAAADAALALDGAQVNAYVQKGLALFSLAPDADDTTAAYRAAREPFLALNKLENNHPLPLIYYYRYYAEQGIDPPAAAVQGLERASELAPFDLGLHMNLAVMQLGDGRPEAARNNLLPIAYDPHGGPMSPGARAVIERIDAGDPPKGDELGELLNPRPDPDVAAAGD